MAPSSPTSEPRTSRGVLLVSMPWGPYREPCLGLSILKSVLARQGVSCDVLHASMRLLRYLHVDTLEWIAGSWAANDFVFTREFEDAISPHQLHALQALVRDWQDCLTAFPKSLDAHEPKIAKLVRMRQEIVPRFLDDLMAEIDFSRYSLVGFSCLFDQTLASLAFARRIRRQYPALTIAFGGYALHRPVGPLLQNSFPEMDVVAYGDGEPIIFPLWQAACGERPLSQVPNISWRRGDGGICDDNPVAQIPLEQSPVPDYDDFFLQREELGSKHRVTFTFGEMQAESSRGCWFGQKSHCTFCGIDDETLKYRTKPSAVVIDQLDQLHSRYGVRIFRFSDYIMPMQNFHDFLPEMIRRGSPYRFHYETKANLTEAQISLCAQAGIRFLQPGIESFNSRVLKLMSKGVSAAQNIFALYTMVRRHIYSFYNVIFGFPFETAADYEQMAALLPALYHLIPPQSTVPVLVTRYAPLAADPERFGSSQPMSSHWRYDVIFSSEFRRANNLRNEDFCYYYDSPYRDFDSQLKVCHDVVQHQIVKWKERFDSRRAHLWYWDVEDGIRIEDTRLDDAPRVHRFGEVHRIAGEVMRGGLFSWPRLLKELNRRAIQEEPARRALDDLLEKRVVIQVDAQFVWLALPEGALEQTCVGFDDFNAELRSIAEWPPREYEHAGGKGDLSTERQTAQLVVLG